MNRRGFFGRLVAFVAAPFAAKVAIEEVPKVATHPPMG
jgi:hypothetical protein